MKLRAQSGDLPLSFQQYETLQKGSPAPLLGDNGKPLSGARLDRALAAEGIGLKRVKIAGEYAEEGGGDLKPWSREVYVPGTLDTQGLARLSHQVARDMIQSKRRKGTPPESYITSITVERAKSQRPRRRRKAGHPTKQTVVRGVSRVTVYRDARGKFISRAKYQRTKNRMATAKPRKPTKRAAKKKR